MNLEIEKEIERVKNINIEVESEIERQKEQKLIKRWSSSKREIKKEPKRNR